MSLARGTVRLENYKEAWAEWFEDEADRLRPVFGEQAPIEHIGSTAIPGVMAKSIIDMMVGVAALSQVTPAMIRQLEELGYRYMPERVSDEEIFMPKGPDSHRTHYLHIVPRSNKRWDNTILFRDYLTAHKKARNDYTDLKLQLAKRFANDRVSYTNAKTSFVSGILAKAKE